MTQPKRVWIFDLLLIPVLIAATYLRVIGLNWDDNQHLHPDERFLTMVETALQVKKCSDPSLQLEACPPDEVRSIGFGDYLDTATSPLNPQNRGFGFFVYGDFPIILVRYIAEWVGQTGYDQVDLVGRQVSALGDLLTILLIYIIAARLYDRRVALLTASFTSLAVLEIQLSHFFIVDTVANLFIFLAAYFAIQILLRAGPANTRSDPGGGAAAGRASDSGGPPLSAEAGSSMRGPSGWDIVRGFGRDPFFLLSLGFGVALGLAVASKLNAAPLAIVLPGAFLTRYFLSDRGRLDTGNVDEVSAYWSRIALYLVAGGAAAVLAFRLAQPYAFAGLGLNPAWLDNIKSLQAQSNGSADVPFALQWARRSHLFSFENLTRWGLGLPLGILAWIGFVVMGWRVLKGELKHLVLWGWTGLYFGWQSTVFNPTMRYQLPVYPLLCMMAGWVIVYVWDQRKGANSRRMKVVYGASALMAGCAVLMLSAAWAFAFTRIYTRPVTRVAASEWIYQNVPGPINVRIRLADGTIYQQPLPFTGGTSLQPDAPYMQVFGANATGQLESVFLPHVAATQTGNTRTLRVSIGLQADPTSPEQPLATGSVTQSYGAGTDGRGEGTSIAFGQAPTLTKGDVYYLHLETDGPVALAGAAPINESDWDDGLPLRMDGYDAYGGLYTGGLNLQIYFDDNADKLKRFVDTLTQGDYIFMSSNRQWASVTRIPERYPLTTVYYRDLIGCPAEKDVIWCYNVATPGMFQGKLGYKLVAVFESFPTLDIPGVLHWQANDQFAEEAFTVYDHPKVLIFQKQLDFSRHEVQKLLGAVDLSNVVHLTPGEAGSYKSLMLSAAAWARQQAGGTWSQLFSYQWLQNRFQIAGLLIWYVFILTLGLLIYPNISLALPGLGDKGNPMARVLGLLLLGYLSWL
ncbi:MAG: hypothetical protein ACK2T0_00335, partial [Anaerolineales bacterium]